MSFTIMNLSEHQADCFLIILENKHKKQVTILVDGNGKNSDYQNVKNIIDESCKKLDIIAVSHVDDDHLGGIIEMLKNKEWECAKDAVILYNHVAKGTVSYEQAKTFEELIEGRRLISSYVNEETTSINFLNILTDDDRKNCVEVEKNKDTTAYLSLIKPFHFNLEKVRSDCKRVLANDKKENAGLINRNSLVFLLEFEGKSAIFTGDATWKQIETTLDKILPSNYIMDLIKIPHHGAKRNNINLANYANTHGTKYFLVTGKEQWNQERPAESLIKEIAEKCPNAQIYTLIKNISEGNIKTERECKIEK